MNMMSLRSFTPPPPKPTPRQLLDELVRQGYRPYICGDPGYGILIVWAISVYVEKDLVGEPGFRKERWQRWNIPTVGLVPDMDASIARVADATQCDNVRLRAPGPELEYLVSSSVMLYMNDLDEIALKPVVEPVPARA